MLKSMTYDDLMWWRAYEMVEPFGELRADYHAASVCAAVFNAMLLRVGSQKRMRVEDFLLEFQDATKVVNAPPTKAWQQMKTTAKMFFAASKQQSKPKPRTQRPPRPEKPRARR